MRRINLIAATLALAGMAASVPGVASAAAQSGGGGAGGANECQIVVSRNASAGVFDVTREVLQNGKCFCYVSTGPRTQGGSAESAVAAIQLRRSCPDAPLASRAPAGAGGGPGAGLWIGLGLAGVGGLVAGVTGGSHSP